jgi:hypothetical protein
MGLAQQRPNAPRPAATASAAKANSPDLGTYSFKMIVEVKRPQPTVQDRYPKPVGPVVQGKHLNDIAQQSLSTNDRGDIAYIGACDTAACIVKNDLIVAMIGSPIGSSGIVPTGFYRDQQPILTTGGDVIYAAQFSRGNCALCGYDGIFRNSDLLWEVKNQFDHRLVLTPACDPSGSRIAWTEGNEKYHELKINGQATPIKTDAEFAGVRLGGILGLAVGESQEVVFLGQYAPKEVKSVDTNAWNESVFHGIFSESSLVVDLGRQSRLGPDTTLFASGPNGPVYRRLSGDRRGATVMAGRSTILSREGGNSEPLPFILDSVGYRNDQHIAVLLLVRGYSNADPGHPAGIMDRDQVVVSPKALCTWLGWGCNPPPTVRHPAARANGSVVFWLNYFDQTHGINRTMIVEATPNGVKAPSAPPAPMHVTEIRIISVPIKLDPRSEDFQMLARTGRHSYFSVQYSDGNFRTYGGYNSSGQLLGKTNVDLISGRPYLGIKCGAPGNRLDSVCQVITPPNTVTLDAIGEFLEKQVSGAPEGDYDELANNCNLWLKKRLDALHIMIALPVGAYTSVGEFCSQKPGLAADLVSEFAGWAAQGTTPAARATRRATALIEGLNLVLDEFYGASRCR